MKRRTFISLMSVMAAAGVLTLSGCSNSSGSTAASGTAASVAPAAGDQLSNIQSSGKLIVALEGAWQPWSYHDASDTLVGYDVEVSRAIAEKLGVEPEYVESDWDSLFAGLDAGRYDIVCNGVEVTDERAKTYDFTEPYGYIHTALAVRKDNDEITSFEDLKGKTTANSLASTYMELAESYGATVQGIDTLEETIQLRTAKAAGAKIILLTHYEDSPGALLADVVLLCGAQESPLDSGSIPIKAAFLYVGEVLVLRYMLDDPAHSNTAQDLTSEAMTVKML